MTRRLQASFPRRRITVYAPGHYPGIIRTAASLRADFPSSLREPEKLKFGQAKLGQKCKSGVEMRSFITIAIIPLLVLTALSLGLAFAEETIQADENTTAAVNETVTNETLGNNTLNNESLENATLTNETLCNLTVPQNETNPFGNVKGRQPSRR
jgi:hypothetical protein